LATVPEVQPYAASLQINAKIVALNEYGVAFKQNAESRKIVEEFNKTAREEDFTKSVESYIKTHMSQEERPEKK